MPVNMTFADTPAIPAPALAAAPPSGAPWTALPPPPLRIENVIAFPGQVPADPRAAADPSISEPEPPDPRLHIRSPEEITAEIRAELEARLAAESADRAAAWLDEFERLVAAGAVA
jgi:hypothetical protein